MFRDYGYRIEPSFYQMFNKHTPVLLEEHLLPVPPLSKRRMELPSSDDGGYTLGLQDILNRYQEHLDRSTNPKDTSHIDLFLCGRLPIAEGMERAKDDSDQITVDLLEDQIPDVSVDISIDIDSVIWTTYNLKFARSVTLLLGISFGHEAPISRNNHVYVNILPPLT